MPIHAKEVSTMPPGTCPKCKAPLLTVSTSPQGIVCRYACGAEYLEGNPPKPVRECMGKKE